VEKNVSGTKGVRKGTGTFFNSGKRSCGLQGRDVQEWGKFGVVIRANRRKKEETRVSLSGDLPA